MGRHIKPGDCVVYRKQKFSAHPGRHARNIFPAVNGDNYSYFVEKFYRVLAVLANQVVVLTRRGRQHTLAAEDPALRRAHWWERLLLRRRFPPACGD